MAKIKMHFKANFHNINLIRVAIKGVFEEVVNSSQDADDLLLSITEAMNNIVCHSNASTMEAILTVAQDKIIFQMITEGEKFDSTKKAEMPNIDDQQENGFGLALIQALVDSMDYEYKDGKNVLTLGKNLLSDDKEE